MSRTRRPAGPPSGRGKTEPLKTPRGRKVSSRRWLERQLADPYVAEAKRRGYPSRAAFKLIDLDDRFRLMKRGARVVDLGAAPGGWTSVAVERVGAREGAGRVVALDTTEIAPIAGAEAILGDIFDEAALDAIRERLGGPADVVLSDMAAASTGHAATDHLRIVGLCEAALDVAAEVLAPGGAFVCKVLQGGTETALLAEIKRRFAEVRHAKPPSSRADSAEVYLVAKGFRGPTR